MKNIKIEFYYKLRLFIISIRNGKSDRKFTNIH